MAIKSRRARWMTVAAIVAAIFTGLAGPALADTAGTSTLTAGNTPAVVTTNVAYKVAGCAEVDFSVSASSPYRFEIAVTFQGAAFTNVNLAPGSSTPVAIDPGTTPIGYVAVAFIGDTRAPAGDESGDGIVIPTCPTAANPTASATVTGADTGTVKVTVTNTADGTGAVATYTVTACDGTTRQVTVTDGQSGAVTFTGIPPGNCTFTVAGDDGTSTSTTVNVPAPPVDLVTVHAKSLGQSCPTGTICTGAHIVVTQADTLSTDVLHAPAKVTLSNGDVVDATFDKLTGGTAQYVAVFTGSDIGKTVVDITKDLPKSWVDGSGQFNLSNLICAKVPKPKNPTISGRAQSCVVSGGSGAIGGSVTNTADDTKAAADYTVTANRGGVRVGPAIHLAGVADGASASYNLTSLPTGSYTVTATGDDGTYVSIVVSVEVCSLSAGHHFPPPVHRPQPQSQLAATGTMLPVGWSVLGALALLVIGGLMLLVGRRRKA